MCSEVSRKLHKTGICFSNLVSSLQETHRVAGEGPTERTRMVPELSAENYEHIRGVAELPKLEESRVRRDMRTIIDNPSSS